MPEENGDADGSDDDAQEDRNHRDVAIGAFLGRRFALAEYAKRDTKRTGDDAQRPDDAEYACGGDRSDAD